MNRPAKPIRRRDATGHIDPRYARDLLAKARETQNTDSDRAFIDGHSSNDELAEELGEAFIEAATSDEETEPNRHDRITAEENGGPFVETSGNEEFAAGTDDSNIAEATREPIPRTSNARR